MKSYSFLRYVRLFTCFLLIPQGSCTRIEKSSDDIVDQTCKTCAQTTSFNLSYDFCLFSLGTGTISHVTNLAGLGLVAMELALGNATNTVQIISKMLDKNTSVPHCQSCVESCLELYSAMSAILQDSISEFLSKQYDPVYMWVSTIMQATNICEESFTVEGEESPLTKENYSLTQLCGIVLCIIDLISPVLDSQSSRAVT